jgi:aminoglycoside phosphotransferase family enzyme
MNAFNDSASSIFKGIQPISTVEQTPTPAKDDFLNTKILEVRHFQQKQTLNGKKLKPSIHKSGSMSNLTKQTVRFAK